MLLLYFLVPLLLLAGSAKAQSPAYRHYTVKDGLSSCEVYDVFQDSKGYIWFATNAGVSRFDGYRFRNFSTLHGLADNTIFEVYEDYKHRIWFRSRTGKLSYFFRDSMYTISVNEQIAANVQGPYIISSLYVDKGDTIWMGYNGGKFFKMFNVHTAHPGFEQVVNSGSSIRIASDGQGMIWSPGMSAVRNYFRLLLNNTTHDIPCHKSLGNDSKITRVNRTDKWVASLGNELYSFDTRSISAGLKLSSRVIALTSDSSNNLWVGTYGGGAMCFPNGDITKQPTLYFPGSFITDVYQDREKGCWFTTLSEGIFYMPGRDIHNYTTGVRATEWVTCIVPDGRGKALAGLYSGKLCLFDAETERQRILPLPNRGPVRDIHCDSTGNFWVCTSEGFGYLRYPVYERYDKFRKIYVKEVIRESDDTLLFMNTGYIFRLSTEVRDPVIKSVFPLNATPLQAQCIFKDAHGVLWIGCCDGLRQYSNNKMICLGENLPQLKNRIDHIIEPFPGELWLATKGHGIIVFRKNEGRSHSITPENGLASNVCTCLYADSTGIVWAGTNNGVSKIRRVLRDGKVSYDMENINTLNGLISNEVRCLTRSGRKLWVGTSEGVSVFTIENVVPNTTVPPVYITTVSIHGKPVALQDYISLRHDQNFIAIDFVGLAYKSAGKVQYKLKMEGIDRDWIYTDQPNAQYTTLPPGQYTFVVYAVNNDGCWSSEPASISFSIDAPYWEKWWFRTGMGFSLTSSIFLFFLVRYNSLKRTEQEKTALSRKVMETELKALRAQMNPHFIFNSLNSIQNYIIDNDGEAAHKYLGKFSRLIRNVLNNSKADFISLEEELHTLELYIELEALRFKGKFDYVISVEDSIDTTMIKIPGMIIQPFVENAIWHGLMLKKDKGLIEIKLMRDNNRIRCVVRDNGIGREMAAKAKSKNAMHKSMGIALAKERLEMIGMRNNTDLSIRIRDLYSEDGLPVGTEVEMYFQ